jgi:two-component system CheB/CheR fusion protein
VFAEALGHDAFRDRVKVYATDLDMDALTQARHGSYAEADVASIPPDLLERYFERTEQRFTFRKELRRAIIFGRNDLIQDAPISRIDLLACRNTLMYFDAATQAKVLTRFHFALNDEGFLFLGRAETLLTHDSLFTPVDLRRRVFAKVPRFPMRDRHAASPRHAVVQPASADPIEFALRDSAFDAGNTPQFIIDRPGRLALVNERARALFQLGAPDLGRPLQDLEVSYRPFELRSAIDQAYAELRTVARSEVPWRAPNGDQRWYDIVIAPLVGGQGEPVGASISFTEVTRHKQLQQQIEASQVELEAAYQELQSTNEELETTNEELHSTVEELETTNEELQSTNEELETMNEELQSTNEELQTINDELRVRSDELNRILVWNPRAEDLWGLRSAEVEGTHFLNLDIGLSVEQLRTPIRACLAGDAPSHEITLPAVNRRGRAIHCKTFIYPLVGRADVRPHGVIVTMDEQPISEPNGDD